MDDYKFLSLLCSFYITSSICNQIRIPLLTEYYIIYCCLRLYNLYDYKS
jgi:hypothetical protein